MSAKTGKRLSSDQPGPAITAELLERYLDRVAQVIARDEMRAAACLPIYQRLDWELSTVRERARILDEIRRRVRRSRDQT